MSQANNDNADDSDNKENGVASKMFQFKDKKEYYDPQVLAREFSKENACDTLAAAVGYKDEKGELEGRLLTQVGG